MVERTDGNVSPATVDIRDDDYDGVIGGGCRTACPLRVSDVHIMSRRCP
jgi:hypothetical protein